MHLYQFIWGIEPAHAELLIFRTYTALLLQFKSRNFLLTNSWTNQLHSMFQTLQIVYSGNIYSIIGAFLPVEALEQFVNCNIKSNIVSKAMLTRIDLTLVSSSSQRSKMASRLSSDKAGKCRKNRAMNCEASLFSLGPLFMPPMITLYSTTCWQKNISLNNRLMMCLEPLSTY